MESSGVGSPPALESPGALEHTASHVMAPRSPLDALLKRVGKNDAGEYALQRGDVLATAKVLLAQTDGDAVFASTTDALHLLDTLSESTSTAKLLCNDLIDPLLAHLESLARDDRSKRAFKALAGKRAAWTTKTKGPGWR